MTIEEAFVPITRLLDDGLPAELEPAHRLALAIKLVRISVLGCGAARPVPGDWRDDDEVAFLAAFLRRLLALAPGVLAPFSLKDRRMLDGLLAEPTIARVTADVVRSSTAGRRERWLTKNPLHSFNRESALRRYALYFLKRERKAGRS